MAEAILMISLSPTMEKGTIAGWQKSVGDSIATGDLICEVETDKATMDYESTQEGTLLSILVDQGGSAKVGDPIAIVGKEGEDIAELEAKLKKQLASSEGDEKATPPNGTSSPTQTKANQAAVAASPPAQGGSHVGPAGSEDGRLKASPLARRLAQEAGISLDALTGSGPGGRIVKKDIETAKTTGTYAPSPVQSRVPGRMQDRVEPVSGKRAIIAKRLSESMRQAPHYYLDIDVEASRLARLRDSLNRPRQKRGEEKLSFNAFLIKLVAEAITRNQNINASWEGDSIRYYGSVDIGLAVAQKEGLITPVVRNCEAKGIAAIDEELKELIPRAQAGRLTPEEYEGASFSITNLGSWGISRFTAVINPPASAILAVGALRQAPVPDEELGFRFVDTMTLTLGCDHRVIDGAVGAAFMADLKSMMEEPGMVLL
ncbi:2-oxo acid dehydrogenase subunit E2 [Sediminispirochaeta smaragdinae]|uniref:Dihydrolipoamide acetyltransferase component of pyruvate dehydrogenase complex n=1 Tax=Sediminispirochaeta smaragdinae (strain DSM 11293 / JCM 15392 / SEBR 4228) TaxID=573413 RepID=E1RBK4_SEDSS|nr:2-oxo acid dehydrogenase subunit E2 [Sediminispirochaeta smaragdinae]ADK79734.1 catalytic domain of components of various dehydrogenase complexes [Sediminispirochaeta smaragdinae DSM 11293]